MKPCPFCGGEPHAYSIKPGKGKIVCSVCGSSTRVFSSGRKWWLYQAEKAWDKRKGWMG